MSIGKKRNKVILYTILSIIALLQLFPLILTLFNSFRTDGAIKKFPVGFPTEPNIDNFIKAWKIGGYTKAFSNSFTISIVTTVIIMFVSIIAGYFLVRSNLKIKNLLFVYFGIALSIPIFSYLVPLYYTFSTLNLVNSKVGLIMIYVAIHIPFNTLLARTFILGIPRELDEAAIIDGCSTYQILARIIFPLAKPIMSTIALIVFVATWNEFTLANTFLQQPMLKTAATRYVLFVGERGSDLSMVYTAGIITMLPIIIAFFVLQNFFIDGMTSGSIK